MAKGSITQVAVTDTFQQWLNKTNDLVNLMNGDVMTASPGGDTTIGNAKLQGNFAANNITVNTTIGVVSGMAGRFSELRQQSGNTAPISVTDMISITAANTLPIRLTNALGPRIRYDNSQRTWDVGHGNTNANSSFTFIWDSAVIGALTTTGYLELKGGLTANGNTNLGSGLIKVAGGTNAQPGYGFSTELDSGVFLVSANNVGITSGGETRAVFSNTQMVVHRPIRAANGTALLPSYAFQNSNSTGMWLSGNANASFSANGNIVLSYGKNDLGFHGIYLFAAPGQEGLILSANGHVDLDTNIGGVFNTVGVRIGRNSTVSRFSWLKPNTSTTYVNIQAGDDNDADGPTANGGFVQVLQSSNLALPGFSFINDVGAGLARTGSNTISLVTGGLSQLRVNTSVISIRGGIGIQFDPYVNPNHRGDISYHLGIYGKTYGLGVTGSSLNIVSPNNAAFRFVSNSDGAIALEIYNNSNNAIMRMGGNGSESTPCISFIDDINTGIWRPGPDSFGISVGGQHKVTVNGAGITLSNDGRFIAANKGQQSSPDFCFYGAGGYGMYYASSYLRFSAAGSQVVAISPTYNISYSTYNRMNNIRWNDNTNDGFGATSNYTYAIVADTSSHRFDLNGAVNESVITRALGDARYQRTSSRRFKDKLVEINDSLEARLLKAFDLFNIKTWTWGKEIAECDERYGTQGIGFVVEELEEFLPEAVRYQWIQDEDFDADSDDIPTKKQAHALDESPIIASLILKIRQLEARLEAVGA